MRGVERKVLTARDRQNTLWVNMLDTSIPQQVADLVQAAAEGVREAFHIPLDLAPETLPLVDQYLRLLPAGATEPVRRLITSAAGCYFGEVVRRLLQGWWTLAGPEPEQWRVELAPCLLSFHPVGMAGEVLTRGQDPRYDGTFTTAPAQQADLQRALAQAAPLPEEEYYSLAGRVDVLQLAAELLTAAEQRGGRPGGPYTAKDYRRVLG